MGKPGLDSEGQTENLHPGTRIFLVRGAFRGDILASREFQFSVFLPYGNYLISAASLFGIYPRRRQMKEADDGL